jgi:hypothetical protein
VTVHDLVKEWLASHGYDGLYDADDECGCTIDDLAPCDGINKDCTPGYKVRECADGCGLWTVGPDKPGAEEEGEA